MKKSLLIIIILCAWNCNAQYEGFYSTKNEVNISTGFCLPSVNPFSLLRYSEYSVKYLKVSGKRLKSGSNVIDLNFNFGYSHAFKGNFAVGFEANYERGNFGVSSLDIGNGENQYFENFRTNSFTFIPKLIFATKNSLLPVGLSHQIGIGYGLTKVRQRDYAYAVSEDYYPIDTSFPITDYEPTPINYSLVAKNIKVMYELNVKTPISESMTINYGIRYNINIPMGYTIKEVPVETPAISNTSIYDDIKSMRWRKVASFNLGVSYLF